MMLNKKFLSTLWPGTKQNNFADLSPEEHSFNEMRAHAFSVTPQQLGTTVKLKTVVYGVIMDMEISGIMTIVCFKSGDASLYVDIGGSMTGGRSVGKINRLAKQFVSTAQRFLPATVKTDVYPLPAKEMVYFYLLTTEGVFQLS